ncbi:MAG: xylulokinase [Acidobacteriota bacterium]|nr:xylulokinase [Acidobacteriota bacterium]
MPQRTYLGIDCGTQGTKALLVGEDGAVLGRGYAPHALVERADGTREQDPSWWVEALSAAVRAACGQAPDAARTIVAAGVSGQQHGLVVLDEAMHVIRPAKLWNDTSTAAQNAMLVDHFGGPAEWIARFGIVPLTGYTVSKLLWLMQNEPANFARIRHILLPHEYLNWWLTGELCAEPGDASGTGYFDNRSRRWIPEVLAAIDGGTGQLAAALPRLLPADAVVGTLRLAAAQQLGLPPACLVSAGGGDNMMGAIGTANVREGVVTLSLGTSSTVYSFAGKPSADASGAVAPFCSSSGGWLPLVCTMNATNVVTATVELLGRTVAAIDPALESTAPGADGLVLLPFLNGERTPDMPNARGTLTGLSSSNLTPEHLIRAAVEGVSFGILNGLDLILAGSTAAVLQAIGGGARSRGWRQLLADATGVPVQVPAEEEAGCLGAAIQARVAFSTAQGEPLSFADAAAEFARIDVSATVHPRPDRKAAYDAARRAYREALRLVHPV